jgi:hypothetical protein
MTRFLMLLVPLTLAVLTLANEARPTPVHDYIFTIVGVVTTEDSTPIQGAEITLVVNGPVYKGVELVKTATCVTDDAGGFAFTYMSHKRGVKYTITVRKVGFESQTVSGSSPPAAHHAIKLRRSGGDATPPQRP